MTGVIIILEELLLSADEHATMQSREAVRFRASGSALMTHYCSQVPLSGIRSLGWEGVDILHAPPPMMVCGKASAEHWF